MNVTETLIKIKPISFVYGIYKYAMNYKDQRQCYVDLACRVVNNSGDSLYDECRKAKDAREFTHNIAKLVSQGYYMGIINDNLLARDKEYIEEWSRYMPTTMIGWIIFQFVMECTEKKKYAWVESLNSK